MAFDFKKEYKEFYLPKKKPGIIDIPSMNFVAISGKGDPNEEGGTYKEAIELLYGIAYTIKMSYKSKYSIEGFFEYVVPPLECLWWMVDMKSIDYNRKKYLRWISMIRIPDFVKETDFEWAVKEATRKKKKDFSKVMYLQHKEGLCVQCMHMGAYDNEPATIRQMEEYANKKGYTTDITSSRLHHEIYLKDPRKCSPEKLKTVIRIPVKPG